MTTQGARHCGATGSSTSVDLLLVYISVSEENHIQSGFGEQHIHVVTSAWVHTDVDSTKTVFTNKLSLHVQFKTPSTDIFNKCVSQTEMIGTRKNYFSG